MIFLTFLYLILSVSRNFEFLIQEIISERNTSRPGLGRPLFSVAEVMFVLQFQTGLKGEQSDLRGR